MSGTEPSPLLRLVATLLFVGGPLAFAAVAALSAVEIGETRQTLERRLIELQPLRGRITRLSPSPEAAGAVYLPGASHALAAAALQQRLGAILRDAGARVVAFQAVDDPDATDVLIDVTFEATSPELMETLVAIETGLPLIRVETLSVRSDGGGADPAEAPPLRVELTVRAFRPEDAA